MSESRRKGNNRPESLDLKFHDLEVLHDGTSRVLPDEASEEASSGKRFIQRLCPRVVRKFISRWLTRGESRSKSMEGGELRGATSEELSSLLAKVNELLKVMRRDEPCRSHFDQECIVCVNARAVLETYPCRHRVLCKSCFLRTIQVAISQEILPLQCVLCRSEIYSLNEVQDCDLSMDFALVTESVRKVSAPNFTAKNLSRNYDELGIVRTPTSESEFFMEMLRHPDEPSLLGGPPRRKPRRPTFYERASNFSNALPRSSNPRARSRAGSRISPTCFSKTKAENRSEEKTPELLSPQEQFRFQFHQGKMAALRERRQLKSH